MSATYRPSPLSFGSPRTSPFRRPESPASPSTVRATTPTPSPTKAQTPVQSPSKIRTPTTSPTKGDPFLAPGSPLVLGGATQTRTNEAPTSPSRRTPLFNGGAPLVREPAKVNSDALSKLNPAQVRELREAFQVLDRDSDGLVGAEDVVDMLNSLGQDSLQSTISAFFPPGTPANLTLPQFLTQLSVLLASMSRPEELISAFSAFDDNDNGEVDIVQLRDALMHTVPEQGNQKPLTKEEIDTVMSGFVGRKTFGKKSLGKGEVFRYHDFIGAVHGDVGKGGDQQPRNQ